MCKIDEIQDRLKGPGLYAIVINQRGFFYTILFFFKAFFSVVCERPIPAVGNYIRLIDGWLLLLPTTDFFIFFFTDSVFHGSRSTDAQQRQLYESYLVLFFEFLKGATVACSDWLSRNLSVNANDTTKCLENGQLIRFI